MIHPLLKLILYGLNPPPIAPKYESPVDLLNHKFDDLLADLAEMDKEFYKLRYSSDMG
jgi:hypothetical protein